jgi:hypothetical protein
MERSSVSRAVVIPGHGAAVNPEPMHTDLHRHAPRRPLAWRAHPLTAWRGHPHHLLARRSDGRSSPVAGRGKSGLHGGAVPGNARRGRPQGKCHRKYTAGPVAGNRRAARVKRCGKSAPRRRQRRRQGKPHREQDQVGAAGIPEVSGDAGRAFAPPLGSVARGARQRASQRNGHHRPKIVQGGGTEPGLHAVWQVSEIRTFHELYRQ